MIAEPTVKQAGLEMSTTGTFSHILNEVIEAVCATILSVIFSGAGPPFSQLYLMPKSSVMPPGLCDAEQMKPPKGLNPPSRERITADVAGVDSKPPVPTQTVPTPAAKAILIIIWIALSFQ